MALYSDDKWRRFIEQREDIQRERFLREKAASPKSKAAIEPIPRPEIVVPLGCEFKGCPYPITHRFRDINADSYICLYHAKLMDEEAGQFDAPLRDSFYDHTHFRSPYDAVPMAESGDGVRWNGFSLRGTRGDTWGWRHNNRTSAIKIENFLDIQKRVRERERRKAIADEIRAERVRERERAGIARQSRERYRLRRQYFNRALVKLGLNFGRRRVYSFSRAIRNHREDIWSTVRLMLAERREKKRAIRDAYTSAIAQEWGLRVQVAEQERRKIHSEVQKQRWQVIKSGGIWVPTRQTERFDVMRTRIWRQVEREISAQ